MSVKIDPRSALPYPQGGRLGGCEGKVCVADGAPLPGSLRLKESPATLIGAGGTDVMKRLTPIIVRLEREYKCARSGLNRLIASLKLKSTVHLYHLALKVTKSVEQANLRKSRVDQLVLEIERQFGHLGGRYDLLVPALRELPKLIDEICAAADEADRRIGSFKKSIHVHWRNSPETNEVDHD